MRTLIASVSALALATSPAFAQSTSSTTILGLPQAGALSGGEVLPLDQGPPAGITGSVQTKQATLRTISQWLYANLPPASSTVPGGVLSSGAPAHQFVTGVAAPTSSTPGSLLFAQPGFADIAGSLAGTQMPALGGDVTSPPGNPLQTIVQTLGGKQIANVATSGSASDLLTGTLAYGLLPFGIPISPRKPDTVEFYPAVTTVAGSCNVTLAGANMQPGDAGKLIEIPGAGPTEGYYDGSIASVTDATHIVTAVPCPTQAMEAISQRVDYGSDQTASIQAAYTYGSANNVGAWLQAGIYMTTGTIYCYPPAQNNGANLPAPMCDMDPGAEIRAMNPMTAVVQYGGVASNYSQVLRNGYFGGGTINGNFLASYGADVPFYIVGIRHDQLTKNTLLSGVRWGRLTTSSAVPAPAPGPSGGSLDSNVRHLRDILYVGIASIGNGVNPTVRTLWDHGYTTGRVVTLDVGGMTQANNQFYQATVTGPRTFTLNNTDSTNWGTFTSGNVALTMPSNRIPVPITGITNTAPVTVSTGPQTFANGMQVFLGDAQGVNLGGVYTACATAPTSYQPHAAGDTGCTGPVVSPTGIGTYTGNGFTEQWDDPLTAEKADYIENGADTDVVNADWSGARYYFYPNPATSGYDGKIVRTHGYNYNENGQPFCGVTVGGNYNIFGLQQDVPFRYALCASGQGNTLVGSNVDYAGAGVEINNYPSLVRLTKPGAQVIVLGGSLKGSTAGNILGAVSGNGFSFGNTPGYSQSGLTATYTSLIQPDSSQANVWQLSPASGQAALGVVSNGQGLLQVWDKTAGTNGLEMYTNAGGAGLAMLSNTGTYLGNAISFSPLGGNVSAALIPGTLTVAAATTLAALTATSVQDNGALNVTGATTLAGLSAGNTSVGGTLGVTGATTLASLSATSASVSGALGVTGASTLAGVTATSFKNTGLEDLTAATLKAVFTANGSVATALSSVGPTGSHTTVQEWFTVQDAAGTTRYIPAF